MSHVATVEIEIKDLDALAEACQRLGVELVRDQKQFRYYDQQQHNCEHAIRIPGNTTAYEVGVVLAEQGKRGFALACDDHAGGHGMNKHVGYRCQKLKQMYTEVVATREAMRQGYRIQRQQLANGAVQLVMTK